METETIIQSVIGVLIAIFGGLIGWKLGRAREREFNERDRVRVEAFKVNFQDYDAQALIQAAESIRNKANEIIAGVERAKKNIVSAKAEPPE